MAYHFTRFGIISPREMIWTRETFETMADAYKHIDQCWIDPKDREKFKVELVDVTITRRQPMTETPLEPLGNTE